MFDDTTEAIPSHPLEAESAGALSAPKGLDGRPASTATAAAAADPVMDAAVRTFFGTPKPMFPIAANSGDAVTRVTASTASAVAS